MSRVRSVRLVAMREIIERGRSRGYIGSLLITVFLIVAGVILPSMLLGSPEAIKLALVGNTPAALESTLQALAPAFEADLVISTLPDRAAAEAALQDETIDAALDVPADLSGPGELIVLEAASATLQGIAGQAVIALRAGAGALPPATTVLEPPSAEDMTAIIFANIGIILMFIGIFSYGSWVLNGVVEEKQSPLV